MSCHFRKKQHDWIELPRKMRLNLHFNHPLQSKECARVWLGVIVYGYESQPNWTRNMTAKDPFVGCFDSSFLSKCHSNRRRQEKCHSIINIIVNFILTISARAITSNEMCPSKCATSDNWHKQPRFITLTQQEHSILFFYSCSLVTVLIVLWAQEGQFKDS